MKYVIYQRVSTDIQDIETQKTLCLKHIEQIEHGKPFKFEIFSDPDTTSRIPMEKREGLQKMLKSLRKGDVVVIFKTDRLSRDIIEMVSIYRIIKQSKCTLLSLSEPGCDNELMMSLLGAFAQQERSNISERTKAKLAAKKSRGERVGYIPYGYQLSERVTETVDKKGNVVPRRLHIELCPIEQEILATFHLHKSQGLTYRQLETFAEEKGIRNRQGGKWYFRDIWEVIRNYKPTDLVPSAVEIDQSLVCV